MSTKEELLTKLNDAQQERQALFDQRDPIDKKLKSNYDALEELKNEIAKLELVEPKTFEQQVEYFLFEDGSVSGERYKARDNFWRDQFGPMGLYVSGYNNETQQSAFSIKLTRGADESLQNHISQLAMLLPYIKIGSDGYKLFNIFEHTLSLHGSYYFLVNERDNEYVIKRGSNVEKKFNNPLDALKYIQINHYYDDEEDLHA
jgi:hypothetical protein